MKVTECIDNNENLEGGGGGGGMLHHDTHREEEIINIRVNNIHNGPAYDSTMHVLHCKSKSKRS